MENKPTFEEIKQRAYFIWQRNKTLSDHECWEQAEKELKDLNNLSIRYLKEKYGWD